MKIKEVVNALEHFAPLSLQADFDNAGMQIGLTEAEVSGALLCLDVTEAIVDEAAWKGCNLIVSHHPLIFHKLRRITDEDYVQRTVMKAIQRGITVVAFHTNLDSVCGGVNYKIAQKLGLTDLRLMGKQQRVAVDDEEASRHEAIRRSFQPGLDSSETLDSKAIVGADGVVGTLAEPMAADDFVLMVKRTFGVECAMCNELLRRPIRTVALCGGAGDFLLDDAISMGADAFITGEMHYHQYFGHEQQLQICVIGHYQSEQFTIQLLEEIIRTMCPEVRTEKTEINTNPILYI